MNQSEQINELATALSKAQGEITGALKDSSNPFFKSKYADLASCWDACRTQLSKNGLSVIQTTEVFDGTLMVVTTLAHSSGQWVTGLLPVKAKDDGPQAQGSGITYARRYALAAIVGIAQVDDDAESAQGRSGVSTLPPEPKIDTRKVNEYADRLKRAISEDNDGLLVDIMGEVKEAGNDFRVAVWATLPNPIKRAIQDKAPRAA
jgi:hypothetical protein